MTAILRDYEKSLEVNGKFYRVKSYNEYMIYLDKDYKAGRALGFCFRYDMLTLHVR